MGRVMTAGCGIAAQLMHKTDSVLDWVAFMVMARSRPHARPHRAMSNVIMLNSGSPMDGWWM